MNDFGNYLRELRGKRSLRDIQKGTGISHTYLSTLEKGYDPRTKKERKPAHDILKKLAVYYGVPNAEMFKKAGYIDIQAEVKAQSELTGTLTVSKDLFTLLKGETNLNFKKKLLTQEEKEKIINFIENFILK